MGPDAKLVSTHEVRGIPVEVRRLPRPAAPPLVAPKPAADDRLVQRVARDLIAGEEIDDDLAGPPDIRPQVVMAVSGTEAWSKVLTPRRIVATFTDAGSTWDLLQALADHLPKSPIGRFAMANRNHIMASIAGQARQLPWTSASVALVDSWIADHGSQHPSGHDLAVALLNEGWKQRLEPLNVALIPAAQACAAERNMQGYRGRRDWDVVIRGDGRASDPIEVPGRLIELPWRGVDAREQCAADHPYRIHAARANATNGI